MNPAQRALDDLTTAAADPAVDVVELARRITTHPWFATDLMLRLRPLLDGRPALVAAIDAAASTTQRRDLQTWLQRHLISPLPIFREDLAAAAHAVVVALDPTFPLPTLTDVAQLDSWYAGYAEGVDTRVAGRGWTIRFEERDEGPAEAIHVSASSLVAHGVKGEHSTVAIYREVVSGGWEVCWWQMGTKP